MNLVTGGAGHLGNVLVRALLERAEPVRVLALPGEDLSSLVGLDVEIRQGNILDPISLAAAMRAVRRVYHLAGMISIQPGKNDLIWKVNVEGTRNVLEAARAAGVERIVYTSSIHALTRPPHGTVIDESLPFDPHNPAGEYDRSKAAASLLVEQAVRDGLNAVIICPTGIIGPHDYRYSEMGSLIKDWIQQPVQFLVDGSFDFVDVRDIAQGLIHAGAKGRCGETYILSGEHIRLVDLRLLVQRFSGLRSIGINTPVWLAKIAARFNPFFARMFGTKPRFTVYSLETVFSNSIISRHKAQSELDYHPRSMLETITDTVHWWKDYLAQKIPVPAKIPAQEVKNLH